jgi:uncharacterized protein
VTLYVDTSVWYAAAASGDRHNRRAKEILDVTEPRITSDHVLIETWLLARHRLGRDVADELVRRIREGIARVETTSGADLERALALGAAYPDQDFSLVDRTSFAVMERLGLQRVASFDDDFAIYRYGRDRKRAFAVVR